MNSNIQRAVLAVVVLFSCSALAEATQGNSAAGKKIFLQNCVVCHGAEGKGNGPAAAGLNPKPANFSDPARQASMTEDKQIHVITAGGSSEKLSPLMPPFGEALSTQQVRDVVAFIRGNLLGVPPTKVSQN